MRFTTNNKKNLRKINKKILQKMKIMNKNLQKINKTMI